MVRIMSKPIERTTVIGVGELITDPTSGFVGYTLRPGMDIIKGTTYRADRTGDGIREYDAFADRSLVRSF